MIFPVFSIIRLSEEHLKEQKIQKEGKKREIRYISTYDWVN
jgi:hypothetical protein